jgi:hypothetical protein
VAHACSPSYSGGRDQEGHSSKPAQQFVGLYLENNQHKKGAGGVAQMVRVLPSKCKAVISNPSIYQKKKKKVIFIGEVLAHPGRLQCFC